MKIVIISRNTYPQQGPRAFRTAELSEQLAKLGHDVTVYTVKNRYDYGDYQKTTNVKVKSIGMFFSTSNCDNTGRYNLFDSIMLHCFQKLLEYPDIEFYFKITKILRNERNVDLLITIAMPHPIHWGTSHTKKILSDKFPKCWIADCGDPYMFDPFNKHPFYFKYFEKEWCASADYITVPTVCSKKGYYPEFINKIHVIPQGFDFSKTPIAQYVPNKVPTFIYAGSFYEGLRDPYSFIDYLLTIKYEFKFIIYSSSGLKESYLKKIGKNIEIIKGKKRKDIIYECSKADFLINIQNVNTVQSPSKLIDYFIAKRPILQISTNFNESQQFEEFVSRNYKNQYIIENGDSYRIENVANSFIKLYEEKNRQCKK